MANELGVGVSITLASILSWAGGGCSMFHSEHRAKAATRLTASKLAGSRSTTLDALTKPARAKRAAGIERESRMVRGGEWEMEKGGI